MYFIIKISIDTKFYYINDCIMNKKVEVKKAKTQNEAADIFTKPLKYIYFFIKMKCVLRVTKKSSLRGH